MGIYEKLGVRTVIHAAGTHTRLGGTIMPLEVLDAMREASRSLVAIDELQAAAGKIIAEITGAESGIVTAGASAALTLATAACVTGMDPDKMNRLPDTTGMKNNVVIQKSHRDGYDHAIRAVGVKLVEVGMPYRTYPYEVEAAINENTAAVAYVVTRSRGSLSLEKVVEIAHSSGVPVIVDAAGELPPAENLRRFIAAGADLVVFSGGKAIRGPQSSGILCGRRDLIMAAAMQNLDMDVHPETWKPPEEFIDLDRMSGPPEHGIGRGFKVGKEDIVGLITALRLYVEKDHEAEYRSWLRKIEWIVRELDQLNHVRARAALPQESGMGFPLAYITLDQEALGIDCFQVSRALKAGEPSIHVREGLMHEGTLGIHPINLQDGDETVIVKRFKEILNK